MKHILITGVSGYFGQRLVRFLRDKPEIECITGIDIRPPSIHGGKFEFVRCDVRGDLPAVFQGRDIDCVIHGAYILPPIHDVALMEDINVNGTKNVLITAARHGVKQIMDCSSSTVYGFHPDNPPLLTEESPLRGNEDFTYAKNKRELEAWAGEFERMYPWLSLFVIRPCFVVGPGFANPLAKHLCKKVSILPCKTAPMQFIHEDDLVEIMYLLLKNDMPGIYNLAADGTIPVEKLVRMLGGWPLKVPVWLLWPLNNLMWNLKISVFTESPSSSMNMIRYPWVVSNDKVKKALGYSFKYTTRTAFEDFVAYMRARGRNPVTGKIYEREGIGMKMTLKGKNVLVTGSSMGIGKGLSECFAQQGANLVLADLSFQKEQLEAWASELTRRFGVRTWTFYGDLTDPDGPEKLYREVIEAVPEVHVLVNNAGICWFGTFAEMPIEKMSTMILLNCMAYAKMSRLFLPAMIERDDGGILNVSSVSAFQTVPTLGLYAATKAFTQSFTEAVRAELPAGSRVLISTLNPPFTRTRLIQDAGVPLDYLPVMMSFMSVEEVATSGVKAFLSGKERYVPGIGNQILYLVLSKYVPHGFQMFCSRILTRRLSDFVPGFLRNIFGLSGSHAGDTSLPEDQS